MRYKSCLSCHPKGKIMKTLTRTEAINLLRTELLKHANDDVSICELAAKEGIFCKGFTQWTDEEMFKKYAWIVEKLNVTTREELDTYANMWQLARQEVSGLETACDVQCEEMDTCHGWDTFPNSKISVFLAQVCKVKARIVDDKDAPKKSEGISV